MVDARVTSEFIQQSKTADGKSLLTTRLRPPRQQTRLLYRPRVDGLLSDAANFPLTLLVGPAGSGKTTALAGYVMRSGYPTAWCRMTADDHPQALLYHLVASFRMAGIIEHDRTCLEILTTTGALDTPRSRTTALEQLVNRLAATLERETLLVLDDYHLVDESPLLRALMERLIAILPKQLHLLLSTRTWPTLSSFGTARARGEVYTLEQHDFAFQLDEARALFNLYERPCPVDIEAFTTFCRGWPLVLQMLASAQARWSSDPPAESEPVFPPPPPHLNTPPLIAACLDSIYPLLEQYLTHEVLMQQPLALQHYLLRTACLRWFDAEVCAAIALIAPLAQQQVAAEQRCLFLEQARQTQCSYQPIFHIYLDRMAHQQLDDWRETHLQAAHHYEQQGDHEGVVAHLLQIGENDRAAHMLEQSAPLWLHQGHALVLLTWINSLPESHRQRPPLLEACATAYRYLGRFEKALQVYEQAEEGYRAESNREGQSRTLRGRAEVYLDTVQPAPAEKLLKQALKLLPRERTAERADILLLQAENWANRGRADVALKLETSAHRVAQEGRAPLPVLDVQDGTLCRIELPPSHTLGPSPSLPSRMLLRSGRLNESRRLLEAALGIETQETPPPSLRSPPRASILAHREPLLLLALLYALLGNGARAFSMALRGLMEAMHGESQLTEAIAHMRVGHAHQVITPVGIEVARRHYEQSLELAQSFGVTRTRVESCMGLTLLHGHSGDLVEAEAVAQEGLAIARVAGDEWIAAMIWLALGGAAVVAGDERALPWLDEAHGRFVRGGDTYGQAVVALWRGSWYLRHGSNEQVRQQVGELLRLAQHYGYEGVLTAPTLFGPRDMALLIPLLLCGRALPDYSAYAQQLLRQAFPTVAADETVEDYHPGYTLRIQMMGSFRVWRGASEIHAREWQREKARQLLQLLLTFRGQWLQREQICALLWPESDLDAAERQFKVTLNALNTALEPYRPPRTAPFFVRRQGLAYSFAPSYGCWIDVDEFELRTTNVPQSDPDFVLRNAQVAVNLYKGDYLAESLYDSWTLEERERLLARYLATATALAERLVENDDVQQAIHVCERVLRRDRCYEEAYQTLMRAYAQSGSRSQALRTYTRCVHALQDDLGIEPLPETTALYERIKHNEMV